MAITAKVVTITPKMAREYLSTNRHNRKLRTKVVEFFAQQMALGEWKSNGETIIFDYNGDLKDGQHRLEAIVLSKKPQEMVVVEGVSPKVMDTIDTGRIRGLGDVLELNSIKNYNHMAALVRRIFKYEDGRYNKDRKEIQFLSNNRGLDYVLENHDRLQGIISLSLSIAGKTKILNVTQIGFYLYVINGLKEATNEPKTFLKRLAGIERVEGTASAYVSNIIDNAKRKKTPLNKKWVLGLVIKAWNLHVSGDPIIRSLTYSVDADLPEVEKIN